MTGLVTVVLILALGGYFALLVWAARDNVVVRVVSGPERYLRMLREIARAALILEEVAARRLSRAFGAFQVNARRARRSLER